MRETSGRKLTGGQMKGGRGKARILVFVGGNLSFICRLLPAEMAVLGGDQCSKGWLHPACPGTGAWWLSQCASREQKDQGTEYLPQTRLDTKSRGRKTGADG